MSTVIHLYDPHTRSRSNNLCGSKEKPSWTLFSIMPAKVHVLSTDLVIDVSELIHVTSLEYKCLPAHLCAACGYEAVHRATKRRRMLSQPEEKAMKKKVISLVIDTNLTNEQLEESFVQVVCRDKGGEDEGLIHVARSVRVLDSDEG